MDEECEEEEQEDEDSPEEAFHEKQDSVSVKLKVTEEDQYSSPEIIDHIGSGSDDISYEQYLNSITKGANASVHDD